MDFTTDFASAQQNISVALVSTTRTATQISAEDVTFHRASSANVARLLDSQNARLLALAEQLLRSATSTFRAHLTDVESIDSHWNNVVDAIDSLLERSDTCLDEYNGRFKNQPTQQSDEVCQPLNAVGLWADYAAYRISGAICQKGCSISNTEPLQASATFRTHTQQS